MMMNRSVLGDYLKDLNVVVEILGTVSVSHLLFVDDTLIYVM